MLFPPGIDGELVRSVEMDGPKAWYIDDAMTESQSKTVGTVVCRRHMLECAEVCTVTIQLQDTRCIITREERHDYEGTTCKWNGEYSAKVFFRLWRKFERCELRSEQDFTSDLLYADGCVYEIVVEREGYGRHQVRVINPDRTAGRNILRIVRLAEALIDASPTKWRVFECVAQVLFPLCQHS
jgi:hypothetical protein